MSGVEYPKQLPDAKCFRGQDPDLRVGDGFQAQLGQIVLVLVFHVLTQ